MRIAAGTADNQHRIPADRPSHRLQVDLEGDRVHRHRPELDLKVLAGFLEGRVSGHRNDHLGPGDAALLGGVVAVGLYRQYNRLRPAGSQRSAALLTSIKKIDYHADNLRLHLVDAGKALRVEGVGVGGLRVDLGDEGGHLGGQVGVDGAGGAAAAPVHLGEGLVLLEEG